MSKDRCKFKAWDKKDKKWIKDFTIFNDGSIIQISNTMSLETNSLLIEKKIGKEVDLMQCTGLKDKKGKLIFEGDIVKFEVNILEDEQYINIGIVTYYQNDLKYGLYISDKECAFIDNFEDNIIEIIGNKYENPELLSD